MPTTDPLSIAANWAQIISTGISIAAVLVSCKIYSLWKETYKAQKADNFVTNLRKKIIDLHLNIEMLRAPKTIPSDSKVLIDQISNFYIPNIKKEILPICQVINLDLLTENYHIIEPESLLNQYDRLINQEIIKSLTYSILEFETYIRDPKKDFNRLQIIEWIFPDKFHENFEDKGSFFKLTYQIVDDKLTKLVESNFSKIYSILDKHLVH